jgi:predicted permease
MKRRLPRFAARSSADIRADVDAELRFHIDTRTEELIAAGVPAGSARAQAFAEFGDIEDARNYLRTVDRQIESERRRRDYVSELRQDVIYALRKLRTAPAFTIAAVLTLALGIGANTAIFSVVNGVLFQPLPFPHAERLLKVWAADKSASSLTAPVSAEDLDDWRAQRRVLADIGGYYFADGGSGIDLTGRGDPERLAVTFVTPGFFSTLGVNALHGRVALDEEMVRGGADRIVVLSYGLWQRLFGSSPAVVGSTLTLNGEPYQVLGVMPASFGVPSERVDAYIPFSTIPDASIPHVRATRIMDVIARMRPGVTLAQAQTELDGIARRLAQRYPEDASWGAATVTSLQDAITGKVRTGLFVLLGAVLFVLLMSCVNVASLLLARAAIREREVAIRVSLGATRWRIVRQMLTESIVLSLAGGIAGVAIAVVGVRALVALAAGQLPRGSDVHIDGTVLLFALGTSLLTGLLFGLVPALRATPANLQETLRAGGRGMISGAAQRLRNGLVIAEVALAVVLVVGAGLMTKSFVTLLHVDPGFKPDHLVAVKFTINKNQHPSPYTQYYHDVIDKVRAVPGVVSAGAAKDTPFRGTGEINDFLPPGVVLKAGEAAPRATALHISDGYFRTIGAPMIAGREFTEQDRTDGPFVIIINQALAKVAFPNESPVGRTMTINGDQPAQIVGVVGDIRQVSMDEPAKPTIYLDNMITSRQRVTLVARTGGEPLAMALQVREAIWSIDKDQTITTIFTFDDVVGESVARPRLLTVLLGIFGVLGLVLGAVGIYGVLAYLVSQRRREIGVRLALGASTFDVLAMVVRRGIALAIAGVVVGLLSAFALTRFLQGVLYGVEPGDPLTFAGVAAIMIAVAALASYTPARRAAHVDPATALRYD